MVIKLDVHSMKLFVLPVFKQKIMSFCFLCGYWSMNIVNTKLMYFTLMYFTLIGHSQEPEIEVVELMKPEKGGLGLMILEDE